MSLEGNFQRQYEDLQSWTKCVEQSKEMKQNWPEVENFDMRFSVIFARYYKSFSS